MKQRKTDNSYFSQKVSIRLNHLPDKESIIVLDCFAGEGKIWEYIKRKAPNKSFNIVGIDKRATSLLKGDNVKFLKGLDLDSYDVLDLDCYGVPYLQLKIILPQLKEQYIFITFIQSMWGILPKGMLMELGYTERMIKKCPTLFKLNGFEKFKRWLFLYGIHKIYSININQKHYIFLKKDLT